MYQTERILSIPTGKIYEFGTWLGCLHKKEKENPNQSKSNPRILVFSFDFFVKKIYSTNYDDRNCFTWSAWIQKRITALSIWGNESQTMNVKPRKEIRRKTPIYHPIGLYICSGSGFKTLELFPAKPNKGGNWSTRDRDVQREWVWFCSGRFEVDLGRRQAIRKLSGGFPRRFPQSVGDDRGEASDQIGGGSWATLRRIVGWLECDRSRVDPAAGIFR